MSTHVYQRKKNTVIDAASANLLYFPLKQYSATVPVFDQFQTAATLAAGDWKVSIDGGAFANTATSTPTNEGQGVYSLPLTAAEVNGSVIMVVGHDVAAPDWTDVCLRIETQPFLSVFDELEGTEAVHADLSVTGTGMSFRKIIQFIKAWLLHNNTQTSTTHNCYQQDSTTVLFAQAVADDTITQSQAKAT